MTVIAKMILDLVLCVLLPVELGMIVVGILYGLTARNVPEPWPWRALAGGLLFGLWPFTLPLLLWASWREHRRRVRHG